MTPRSVAPAALTTVANALLDAEDSSDASLAATARLLQRALEARKPAAAPFAACQPALDDLQAVLVAQFEARRALVSHHGRALALARKADKEPWGPDGACPYASGPASVALKVA